MQIAILKERRPHETRVAAAPDTIEKLVAQGHDVVIEAGAGAGAAFSDEEFRQAGAKIAATAAQAVKGAAVIFKVQRPLASEVSLFKPGQSLVCHAAALSDKAVVNGLAKAGVRLFALELLPRITRAQSMDILSSQANMAGYKAVLDALEHFARAVPMMSTAAGRVTPANVFVMGVGVAGLQAIATAKRLGAVVYATDVRPATKEQVQSLGGKFVAVENDEFAAAQTAGGYAKEMSESYKRAQAALVAETIQEMDIVITTALIPGRPAPVLVSADHVKSMRPGSVIVDLAVEAGGNCPLSEYGKVVTKHGVTLVGHANFPARVAQTTSQLFARNLLNFLAPMTDKESKQLAPDMEDEIVRGTMVTDGGKIIHETVLNQYQMPGSGSGSDPAAPRKRGRPKKNPVETVASEAPSSKNMQSDAPRKRGRPRKNPVEAVASDTPRKRGRPRKNPVEAAASDAVKSDGPPRKRGRPRKNPVEQNPVETSVTEVTQTAPSNDPVTTTPQAAETAPDTPETPETQTPETQNAQQQENKNG